MGNTVKIEERTRDFAQAYAKLDNENQNYVLGILQTLIFAQSTIKTSNLNTQKAD